MEHVFLAKKDKQYPFKGRRFLRLKILDVKKKMSKKLTNYECKALLFEARSGKVEVNLICFQFNPTQKQTETLMYFQKDTPQSVFSKEFSDHLEKEFFIGKQGYQADGLFTLSKKEPRTPMARKGNHGSIFFCTTPFDLTLKLAPEFISYTYDSSSKSKIPNASFAYEIELKPSQYPMIYDGLAQHVQNLQNWLNSQLTGNQN